MPTIHITKRVKTRPIKNLSPLDKEVKKERKKRRKKEAMADLGKLVKVRDAMRKRKEDI
jgi:hypothetical protein